MQIGQRFLVIEPSDLRHEALDELKHAVGAIDESAQDLARIGVDGAIASLVEERSARPVSSGGGR